MDALMGLGKRFLPAPSELLRTAPSMKSTYDVLVVWMRA